MITTILTSSLIAGLVAGLITIYGKGIDFQNEYFKMILKKRIDAYDWIEKVVLLLKSTTETVGDKDHPYHDIWVIEDVFEDMLNNALLNNLWISRELCELLLKLKFIYMKELDKGPKIEDRILIGKKYYEELEEIRDSIENFLRKDLSCLHKVKSILSIQQYISTIPNKQRIAVKVEQIKPIPKDLGSKILKGEKC